MIYKINYKEVSEEEFEIELKKRIDDYIPYNEYYPPKEKIIEILADRRSFRFNTYDKRYKDRLVIKDYDVFVAVEEEIVEIENIIIENEFDPCDDDSLKIAVALYNAGYRKLTHQHEDKGE